MLLMRPLVSFRKRYLSHGMLSLLSQCFGAGITSESHVTMPIYGIVSLIPDRRRVPVNARHDAEFGMDRSALQSLPMKMISLLNPFCRQKETVIVFVTLDTRDIRW